MKVTEANRKMVKAFMKVLLSMNVREDTISIICMMLRDEEQMDEVFQYLKKNPQAKENEILAETIRIREQNQV